MRLQRVINATIRPGEQSGYVAECPDLRAVTEGRSLDEVVDNLRELVALALDDEDLAELGLAPDPIILITMELEPARASA